MTHKDLITAEGEVIPTSKLAEGDIIRCHGCLMEIGPISSREDDVNNNANGPVFWNTARIICQFNETIPKGWFHRNSAGDRQWQVQGNDLAMWLRVKSA